ncbi:hypothetical protein K3740_03445 [Ruegeria conchae]|uniref:hypothetical protein n=1 Tax=Ruegeria conchae TaxID=981384 RepID=UPI0021A3CC93|nr:hypothetical protein [Ruegeria conchae]UWR03767.1 hypothetical protein K3740_03445 [Ruegeria conchae]
MAVQDDRRELEQIELFELEQSSERSRSDTDGILRIGGRELKFELKSTTKDSVTTVRDFGMNHIRKWKDKHWLFGFYTKRGNALRYTRYASPQMMAPWIEEKRKYIEVDFQLAQSAAANLTLDDLTALVGDKNCYSLEDAQALHKKQLSKAEYLRLLDRPDGYSKERMLEILKMRCVYVVERGSTLNNPHIPKNVLEKFPKITEDHAERLRELVRQSLSS